jgi:hypothetical protein
MLWCRIQIGHGTYLNNQQGHKITEYLNENPGVQTKEIDEEALNQLCEAKN